MTRFDKFLESVLDRGAREARKDGSDTIEAQHLLLAITDGDDPSTKDVLHAAGLDYGAVRAALDREFEHSLAAAGVSLAAFELPEVPASQSGSRPGESARLAIERGLGSVGRKADLRPAHLLLGILRARVGTVPRALALAGVDQAGLTAQVERALA